MRFGIGGYALQRVASHGGAAVNREMLAEALGFDLLWVVENHFSVERQCASPFVIAGVLAGATQREAEAALMPVYGRYRLWGLSTEAAQNYPSLGRDRFIIGDPSQAIEEIQRYCELFGVTYLICRMAMPTGPHHLTMRSMRLLSERVMPYIDSVC